MNGMSRPLVTHGHSRHSGDTCGRGDRSHDPFAQSTPQHPFHCTLQPLALPSCTRHFQAQGSPLHVLIPALPLPPCPTPCCAVLCCARWTCW